MKSTAIFFIVFISISTTFYSLTTNSVFKQRAKIHYEMVHTFKDTHGAKLGDLLVEYLKKDIFLKLVIVKKSNSNVDTLYVVNGRLFKNRKGQDIRVGPEDFAGYKILFKNNDSIEIVVVDKKDISISDNITINWNYQNKMFEVLRTP